MLLGEFYNSLLLETSLTQQTVKQTFNFRNIKILENYAMKTLKDFPEKFYPLVVVVGDRREFRPKTIGDILAYSVSTTDLLYLNRLGLRPDTLIVSDKLFLLEDEAKLKDKYGKYNILTIGSPDVNLFSRIINDNSLIRFRIDEKAKIEMKNQKAIVEKYKFDQMALHFYKAILEQGIETPEEYKKLRDEIIIEEIKDKFNIIKNLIRKTEIENIKSLLRKYMGDAILDPIVNHRIDIKNSKVQGTFVNQGVDFGLISLAINPYSSTDEYCVIYVAGRHGPGTSHALRALSMKEQWINHPYGSVIEVLIDLAGSYSDRFQNVVIQWGSETYSENDSDSLRIIFQGGKEIVKVFHSTPYRKTEKSSIDWDNTINKFLKNYYTKEGKDLDYKSPYKERIGEWNFQNGILQFFPKTDFVIHNLTGLSPGVLFELGCSYGLQKKIFAYMHDRDGDHTIDPTGLPKIISDLQIIPFPKNFKSKLPEYQYLLDSLKVNSTCPGLDMINKSDRECADFINATVNSKDVFIVINPIHQKLIKTFTKKLKTFSYTPKTIDDYSQPNQICKFCLGISTCKYLIADITDNYCEGIIALGMATIKMKITLESYCVISKECSMYRGLQMKWTEATMEEDIDEALAKLLKS